jgi:hypothetical protein
MRALAIILAVVAAVSAAAPTGARTRKIQIPPGTVQLRQNLDCQYVFSAECGALTIADNTGTTNNVDYYSCSGWNESGGEQVFELVLPGPGDYLVSAELETDGCDLDIFFLGSCDEEDCIEYGDSGFLVSSPLSPGTYYIVVDGYNGAECEFYMTLTCESTFVPCCPLLDVCVSYDFNDSDHGYWTVPCGGVPVWDWLPVPRGEGRPTCDGETAENLLGTGSLLEEYPPNAGEIAVIGPLPITEDCWCMELCHTYFLEPEWDGANVKVSTDQGATWDLVTPVGGYDELSHSGAMCLPNEPAFADVWPPWYLDCFDLTSYVGSELLIGFFFGSDDIQQYPGWFIRWVKIGSGETPVEETSWGAIKALYR